MKSDWYDIRAGCFLQVSRSFCNPTKILKSLDKPHVVFRDYQQLKAKSISYHFRNSPLKTWNVWFIEDVFTRLGAGLGDMFGGCLGKLGGHVGTLCGTLIGFRIFAGKVFRSWQTYKKPKKTNYTNISKPITPPGSFLAELYWSPIVTSGREILLRQDMGARACLQRALYCTPLAWRPEGYPVLPYKGGGWECMQRYTRVAE